VQVLGKDKDEKQCSGYEIDDEEHMKKILDSIKTDVFRLLILGK
jgi:hypothetical protein